MMCKHFQFIPENQTFVAEFQNVSLYNMPANMLLIFYPPNFTLMHDKIQSLTVFIRFITQESGKVKAIRTFRWKVCHISYPKTWWRQLAEIGKEMLRLFGNLAVGNFKWFLDRLQCQTWEETLLCRLPFNPTINCQYFHDVLNVGLLFGTVRNFLSGLWNLLLANVLSHNQREINRCVSI